MTQEALRARLASPAPKKILTLDGGGIRGLIALEVLAALEQQLAARSSNPDGFVLADYFDFVAGTSTGAIIAAAIAYGMPVARIQGFYRECGAAMFEPANWLERFHNKYRDEAFSRQLQVVFGAEHTLGNAPLRTLLMMVMRNASTDQAWCVTNNPHAKFNLDQRHPHLDLPLWRMVRASAAAPSYFPPESVQVGEHEFIFIDGGISSYNNPAFRALLTATAAPYGVNWATGEQSLLLVSVGTGTVPHVNRALKRSELNLLYDAKELTPSMILSAVHEQDLLCRTFGRCLYGPPIDKEVGDMVGLPALGGRSLFSYVRYNADLTAAGLAELGCTGIDPASVQEMDSVAHLDSLAAVGRQIARVQLRDEHFFHFPPA